LTKVSIRCSNEHGMLIRRFGHLLGLTALLLCLVSASALAARADRTTATAKCAHAASLADVGEKAAAKRIYIALLSAEEASCAKRGLAHLNRETPGSTFSSRATTALKLVVTGLAALLVAALALVLVFVAITWTPVRAGLRHLYMVGRLFDPALKVEPFTDVGAKPQVGTGVTGLVRTGTRAAGTGAERGITNADR
jgi:hypothetical protein